MHLVIHRYIYALTRPRKSGQISTDNARAEATARGLVLAKFSRGCARAMGRRTPRHNYGATGWDAGTSLSVRQGWRAGDRGDGGGRHDRISGRFDPRRGGVPLAEYSTALLHRFALRAASLRQWGDVPMFSTTRGRSCSERVDRIST